MMFNITAFLSYAAVASVSPGHNAIVSMANASKYSLKKSLRFNLGVAIGVFFVMFLCGVFSATILSVFPALKSVMIWVGAGYILWLAWRTLRSEPLQENRDDDGAGKSDLKDQKDRLLLHGIFLQFVNPNTILYGITIFSTFILPYYSSAVMVALFSGILSLLAFVFTACWTLFGSLFQKVVVKYYRIVNAVLALLLVYCAITLVI